LFAGCSAFPRDQEPLNDAAAEDSAPFLAFGGDGFSTTGVVAGAEVPEACKSAESFERGLDFRGVNPSEVSEGLEATEGAVTSAVIEMSVVATCDEGVEVVVESSSDYDCGLIP